MYGKYLTREQVKELTANPASVDFIVNFLTVNGVISVTVSRFGEYITATAPIELWERLFNTVFYQFNSRDTNSKSVVRALGYSLPLVLVGHVTAVFNTVHLPTLMSPKPKLLVTSLRST
jgi:subtilase family serine protease